MKLNSTLIFEEMEQIFSVSTFTCNNSRCNLSHLLMLSDDLQFHNGAVYISPGNALPKTPAFQGACLVISIGAAPNAYCQGPCDYLELDSASDLSCVFNAVQHTFWKYGKWESDLNQCLFEDKGLQALLETSLSIFDNPVYITDENFHVIAYAEKSELLDIPNLYANDKLQNEYAYFLKNNPQHIASYTNVEPAIWIDDLTPYRSLYCSIIVGERHFGQLFMDERARDIKEGDYARLSMLANALRIAIQHRNINPSSRYRGLEATLVQILDGAPVDRAQLEGEVFLQGWHANNRFMLVALSLDEFEDSSQSTMTVCNLFERALPHSIAFPYRDNVIVVIPQDDWGGSHLEIGPLIAPIVREALLKAGISNPFDSLMTIHQHYRMALTALTCGIRHNSTQWVFRFEDVQLDYLLDCCSSEFPFEALCPVGLRRLLAYDRDNGLDYAKTLKVYLDNNCSPTQTAQALYMHRNTLLHRLERIDAIAGFDLGNARQRLYLQIILELLQRQEGD